MAGVLKIYVEKIDQQWQNCWVENLKGGLKKSGWTALRLIKLPQRARRV